MAKALTVQSLERLKPDPARRLEVPDGLLPGFYLVIQPSGARSWAVRYRHAGKPRKYTLGGFPALQLGTARTEARKALELAALGRDPAGEKQEARRSAQEAQPDRDTVEAVVTAFLERHTKRKNRPRSAEEVERTFNRYVLPAWRGRLIHDISRRDIIELLDTIVDRGFPVQANRTLAHVRKMFNWCIDRSIIGSSPCVRIEPPGAETSRDRVLSDDELRLLWLATGRLGWPFGPFVRILLLTGQRRDEISRGSWSELKEDVWVIPSSRTKSGLQTDVPLSEPARKVLADLPRIGRAGYLFTTGGEAPISGYSKGKARVDAIMLAIAREEAEKRGENPAEITITPWRLHDLRRTCATGMARLGTPVHIIEAILNHTAGEISGIAKIYNRYSYANETRRALEAWAAHVIGLVSGTTATNVLPFKAEG
jgi:integrase